jgi:hypothetical protein
MKTQTETQTETQQKLEELFAPDIDSFEIVEGETPLAVDLPAYTAESVSEEILDLTMTWVKEWERHPTLREEQREVLNSWAADRALDLTRKAAFGLLFEHTKHVTPPWHLVNLRVAALQGIVRRYLRDTAQQYIGAECVSEPLIELAVNQARMQYVVQHLALKAGLMPTAKELADHTFVKLNDKLDGCDPYCSMETTATGLILIDKVVEWVHKKTKVVNVKLPFESLMPLSKQLTQ